jgi:hypothetical protein
VLLTQTLLQRVHQFLLEQEIEFVVIFDSHRRTAMSIVKLPRSNGHQSPDGFVWNIRISERVLVTLFIVGGSFVSGVAYGQTQVATRPKEMPLSPAQVVTCPTVAKPNTLSR